MQSKIYDAHSHWLPPEVAEKTTFFKRGWSDIDLLLSTLDKAGIEQAVLLYPTSDAHLNLGGWSKLCAFYNERLAQEVKKHADRLIGAGILPVDKPQDMLKELNKIKELGLSCLSLASSYEGKYLDEPGFSPVLEEAARQGMPVFVHSQIINPIGIERVKDPLLMPVVEYVFDVTMSVGKLMMYGIFSRLPNLKIVFAHFAGVLPFLFDRFDSTYSMLRSREIVKDLGNLPSAILKRIFMDTSGVKSTAMLNMALEVFGPSQIIWGSDFPAKKRLTESIAAVKALNLSDQDKEAVLGGNLMGLLN